MQTQAWVWAACSLAGRGGLRDVPTPAMGTQASQHLRRSGQHAQVSAEQRPWQKEAEVAEKEHNHSCTSFFCFLRLLLPAGMNSPHPHLSAMGTQEEIALGPGSPGETRAQAWDLPVQPRMCPGLPWGLPRSLDLTPRPLTVPPLCLSPFHCSVARRQAGEIRELEPEQT